MGINEDLASHRGTGAIIWKNAGWQEAGLTRVDYGRALMDEFAFKESFRDAAENAGRIKFDVSNFNPSMKGITQYEFNHIINTPSLLQKTTFIENGGQVSWNGTNFVK